MTQVYTRKPKNYLVVLNTANIEQLDSLQDCRKIYIVLSDDDKLPDKKGEIMELTKQMVDNLLFK